MPSSSPIDVRPDNGTVAEYALSHAVKLASYASVTWEHQPLRSASTACEEGLFRRNTFDNTSGSGATDAVLKRI